MRQPGACATSAGTLASRQTIDSSSGVLEIDTNCPLAAHCGPSACASRRQMAYRSGSTVNVKSALGLIAGNPFLCLRWSGCRQQIQQPIRIGLLDDKPAIRRFQKAFLDSTIKKHQQRIVIAIDIQYPTGLV